MKLHELISRVESNDNPYAIRFEPAQMDRDRPDALLKAVRDANHCNWTTAHSILAHSWGRYQIMGFNLYNGLLRVMSIGGYMATPALQDTTFAAFVDPHGFDANAEVNLADANWLIRFATFYNGAGNVSAYIARLNEVAASFA